MLQCPGHGSVLQGEHGGEGVQGGGQDGAEPRALAQSVLKGGWPLSFIKYSDCSLSKCCLHWQLQLHSTSSQPDGNSGL